MVNTPYKRTRSQIKKARTVIVLALVTVMLGIYLAWTHQAQPVAQAEVTATEALTQTPATPTPQPTQAKAVEEVLIVTPTIQATQVRLEPIDWVPLSTTGVSIPTRYLLGDQCTQIPTGWTLFQPKGSDWSHCQEDEATIKLGESLVLPAGVAVIPSYKLPETYLGQTAATSDDLEKPWEVENADPFWERFINTPEKLVRVCLLQDDNEFADTRIVELVVDEDLRYKPTGGGKCITALAEDVNLVVFSFLNEINKTIENGDYKYYEIFLDPIIQGGVNQERWLGGKPLTNK